MVRTPEDTWDHLAYDMRRLRLEGKSYRQIAAQLGMPTKDVVIGYMRRRMPDLVVPRIVPRPVVPRERRIDKNTHNYIETWAARKIRRAREAAEAKAKSTETLDEGS